MLAPSELVELAPLTRWARELGMPDPVKLVEDEWALTDTDAARDEAMRVWGAAGHPSPVLAEITQATDRLIERFDTDLTGHWSGDGATAFAARFTALTLAVGEEVETCRSIGEAMVAAADRIEDAYVDAIAVCADASTRIAAITAGNRHGDPTTRRRVAEVIHKTLHTLVGSCREVRRDFADLLIPTVRAVADQPNTVLDPVEQASEPGEGALAVRGEAPQPQPAAATGTGTTHVVHSGDTLWDIANRYLGDGTRWPEIYAANHDIITDPDLIYPGQHLHIPTGHHAEAPIVPGHPPPPPAPAQAAPAPDGPDRHDPPGPPPSGGTHVPPPVHGHIDGTPAGQVTAHHLPDAATQPRTDPTAVVLPSGGLIAAGLGVGILAAWALGLFRHRHTRPRAATAGTAPAQLPTTPNLVHTLQAAQPPLPLPAREVRRGAPVPPLDHRGHHLLLDAAAGGLALSGPGAVWAVRAAIAGVLCAGGPLNPDHQGTVITTHAGLAHLLGTTEPGAGLARLVVLDDTTAVAHWIQTETLRRRRILDHHGADTAPQLRHVNPYAEPLPPVLAVVPAPQPRDAAELHAVLTQAAPVGIVALLVGDTPHHPTVYIDGEGVVSTDTAHQLRDARLSTMSTTDLHDALHVAATAAGNPGTATDDDLLLTHIPAPGATVDPDTSTAERPASEAESSPSRQPDPRSTASDPPGNGDRDDALSIADQLRSPATPDTPEPPPQTGHDLTATPRTGTGVPVSSPHAPIRLTVLGPVKIATANGPITRGVRGTSKTLLALLAAYPQGRTLTQIVEDLGLGAHDPQKAANRCRTAINSLRKALREATGDRGNGEAFIVQEPVPEEDRVGRYRLDPNVFHVDLWCMLTAVRAADESDEDSGKLAALSEAARAYAGAFANGIDLHWARAHQAQYRVTHLDVLNRIVEITEVDQPDLALAALHTAAEQDPTEEEHYRAMMRIHGRLGRKDAVRRTLNLCYDRLAETGTQPSQATLDVAARQLR